MHWAFVKDKTMDVKSGEVLKFEWTGGHNVYQMKDKATFDACDFTGATNLGATSPVYHTMGADTTYFACQVGLHCKNGQKLTAMIAGGVGNGGAAEPAPAPDATTAAPITTTIAATLAPTTSVAPLTTTVPATLAPTTSVAPLTTTVPATLAPTTSAAPITMAPSSTAAPATTSAPNLVAATVKATVIFTGITKADVDSDLARKALTDGMADSLGVPKDTVYIESMTEVSSRRMLKLKRRRLAAVTLEIVFAIRVDAKEAASLAIQLNSAEQATKSAR